MTHYSVCISSKAFVYIALFVVLICSCSSQDTFIEEVNDDDNALNINITANVARQAFSRGYIPEGEVIDGRYYLSFPLASSTDYNVASVDFRESETPGKGIGIVTLQNNSGDKELKWLKVAGNTPKFYLDNVSPSDSEQDSIVRLPSDNPYVAGVFDETEGKNDLLWGTQEVRRETTNTINFDLHHNMARVKVEITVDKTKMENYGSDFTLEGAKVEITSLNQTPISFHRLSGDLELDPSMENYTPLTFVNKNENLEEQEEQIEWGSVKEDANITVYTTQDFVLPPQGLLEDEHRPRLTITLENGDVYSGILPHAMLIDNNTTDSDNSLTYPVALYFLKEHILTIRTVITEEPPTLEFMPVKVVQWVDKGEFTMEAHQAGIYTDSEFYKLIEYYQNNKKYQLHRYGYEENGVWHFDFWRSVELNYNEIANKIKINPEVDFVFVNNNYTISVKTSTGESKSVTPEQLKRIVIGTLTWENI